MEIGKISIEGNIYNCIMEVRESIVDGKGNTSLLLVKYCEIPDYDKILERIE